MTKLNNWFVLTLLASVCFILVRIGLAIADSPAGHSSLSSASLADSRTAPKSISRSTMGCDPCTFEIGQFLPPYQVRFKVKTIDNKKFIEELVISPLNRSDLSQTLSVHSMTPIKQDKEFPDWC